MSAGAGGIGDERQGLPPGTVLEDKYKIERNLGAGGMGVVYEATHLHLRKRVAIKMLAPELNERDDLIARVVREARSASATGHPNIATVTDLGWVDRTPFFVMELVEGETLEDLILRHGPMPVPRAANIVCQVLDGLQAVHDVGIVHRDLKPSNVMLTQDRRRGSIVKLLDFGISKLASPEDGDDQDLTKPGAVMGTPRHMAPEQVLAEDNIDHRADIHSVGSLLYTLLCGRSPFRGGNATATMAKVLHGDYDDATKVVPGLPRELDAILAKAMAVKRERRFESADAMRNALLPFANVKRAESTEAPDAGPPGVDEDAVMPSNLPPLAAVSGTEVGTSGGWPTAAGEARKSVRPGGVPAGTVLPVGDPGLELDVPDGWRPGDSDRPADGKMPTRSVSIPWGVIAVVAILLAGTYAAWTYRSEIEQTADSVGGGGDTPRGKPGEVVLLMVQTTPKDAIVFVDDVQHAERPIQIPKTGEYVKLRVEANGYEPRVMQVEAKASRRLEIKLDRAKRK